MSLRDTAYDGIIANLPADPSAHHGYFELVEIWEHMEGHRPEGREWFNADEQAKLLVSLTSVLSAHELAFFKEPFERSEQSYNSILQARTTGRLSKILMDRHGFKVARDKGGLGL